jgi:hypothetical protein
MTTEAELKRDYVRFILDYSLDDCLHDDDWPQDPQERPIINIDPPNVQQKLEVVFNI